MEDETKTRIVVVQTYRNAKRHLLKTDIGTGGSSPFRERGTLSDDRLTGKSTRADPLHSVPLVHIGILFLFLFLFLILLSLNIYTHMYTRASILLLYYRRRRANNIARHTRPDTVPPPSALQSEHT